MEDTKKAKAYLEKLMAGYCPEVAAAKPAFIEQLLETEEYLNLIAINLENQQKIIDDMQLRFKVEHIKDTRIMLPNGRAGLPYEYRLDIENLDGWGEMIDIELEGLEEFGLIYNTSSKTITGTPTKSGDSKIFLKFRLQEEREDSELHKKQLMLIINPDPKSLWKNLPSDKEARFWKEDNVAETAKLGEKNIVVASKRGRSHANVGTFRDDDFAYKHFEETGWSVIAVADGAGSAKFSREGSRIACQHVLANFEEEFTEEVRTEFDAIISNWQTENDEHGEQRLNHFSKTHLGKIAFSVHRKLKTIAEEEKMELRDLNSTLIFSLFKQVTIGEKGKTVYVVLSFGVGDCPIVLLDKDLNEVNLLNTLDVGEFGGGTRFITMPSIFSPLPDFYNTRFTSKIISDFSYLMLMTDGIYDPKFEVEANLEKIEKWQAFVKDLQGENEDDASVELDADNETIAEQLSKWLDFWSVGNHDDRTLAIVY